MPNYRESIATGVRWDKTGDATRAINAFQEALTQAKGPAELAEVACHLAHAHRRRCDWDDAIRWAKESRASAHKAGLPIREAEALNAEATVHATRGQFEEARTLFQEILALTTDKRARALALLNLGGITAQQGDVDAAEPHFTEAYDLFTELGDVRGEAFALNSFGRAALERGNVESAHDSLSSALVRARTSMDVDIISLVTLNFAELLLVTRELERAAELATEALGGFRSENNRFRELECVRLLGDIARANGEDITARRHYTHGITVAREIGAARELQSLEERLAAMGQPAPAHA